jgi:two-component system sensor histidine kinase BaeS
MTRRPTALATRITLLCCGVAAVTGLFAALLATGLITSSVDQNARSTLSRLADAAQTGLDRSPSGAIAARRARRVLGVLGVRYGEVAPAGRVISGFPLVRAAVGADDVTAVRAGQDVSRTGTAAGIGVYVEGRPTDGGGVFLVQARTDATAGGRDALRRTVLAILVGVAVAAVAGALVARRLAGPLRRTADAARALAAGHRGVSVAPQGPAEVAEVATAVTALSGALAQSEARQREFLLSVSHDLRTPLTALHGYAESLATGVVPADRTAEVGTTMLAEATRLDRLVRDLLDLARLDAQDVRLEFAIFDLAGLAEGAGRVWTQRCRAAGVRFGLQLAPAVVDSDPTRVRQIVDGLLENALRVTPAGARIVLAVRSEPDGFGVVEIRDGGPGLTPDDLAVAFERGTLYERYRGVRQVGTGLGLAIVARLVSRLGGTVAAGRAPEGGACFTVRLPPPHRA